MLRKKKLILLLLILILTNERGKNGKRFWVKEWLRDRENLSHMKLLKRLKDSSSEDFKNYLRMDEASFRKLLTLVKPHIKRQNTVMRKAISAEERLIVTLRYLATGRTFEDLKFSAIISPQALGKIIPETCEWIYKALKKEYMKFPKTSEEWQEIAYNIETRWNFPNCGGSIDGKHLRIVKPANSGSYFLTTKTITV
ncbi:unnamed protein product [Acanthoscelides obtectus]|uniref:Uncharacterized protein n=2 Tax=Acanthoscelides obtectus TaxID=200917 RepID=A0A9P0Q3Q7_ACAOB|nr:unnamed protein product [Acanthoscelides obtectus]CAK1684513.1 hypothetical protein AOBTE_LOCUS34900 [Acanthoscelides obtectus]